MTLRLPTECKEAGCRARTGAANGYCEKHASQNSALQSRGLYDKARLENCPWRKWYFRAPWRHLTVWFWAQGENSICKGVLPDGTACTRLATECDHIVPHKGNWALFMDRANLQGLCKECHSRKTITEMREENA